MKRVGAGIDPGISKGAPGAIATVDEDYRLIDVIDMPIIDGPKGKRAKKTDRMADGMAIRNALSHPNLSLIATELLWGRPGQGAGSMWRMAQSYGIVLGVCHTMPVPLILVMPAKWKRGVGLATAGKKEALRLARKLWPEHAKTLFKLEKHHGRAEAALIAAYVIHRELHVPWPCAK